MQIVSKFARNAKAYFQEQIKIFQNVVCWFFYPER